MLHGSVVINNNYPLVFASALPLFDFDLPILLIITRAVCNHTVDLFMNLHHSTDYAIKPVCVWH